MTQVREVGMWLKDHSFKSLYLTKVDTTGPPLLYVYISRTTYWSKSEQWHHRWIDLSIPPSAWCNRALYLTSDDHLSWEFRALHNDPWHDTPFILNTYTPSYDKSTPSHAVRYTIIYNWGVVWRGATAARQHRLAADVCACGFITIVAFERTWIQWEWVWRRIAMAVYLYGNKWYTIQMRTRTHAASSGSGCTIAENMATKMCAHTCFILPLFFAWWLSWW